MNQTSLSKAPSVFYQTHSSMLKLFIDSSYYVVDGWSPAIRYTPSESGTDAKMIERICTNLYHQTKAAAPTSRPSKVQYRYSSKQNRIRPPSECGVRIATEHPILFELCIFYPQSD